MTDRDKLQDRRDAKRNAFTLKLEKWRQKNRDKNRQEDDYVESVLPGIKIKLPPKHPKN